MPLGVSGRDSSQWHLEKKYEKGGQKRRKDVKKGRKRTNIGKIKSKRVK
jgi:hypothetical protein